PDCRGQHRGGYPHYDNGDCPGNEPGRSRARSRSRDHPPGSDPYRQCHGALRRQRREEGRGMTLVVRYFAAGCMLLWAAALPAAAQQQFITVASTTSTEESGLFRHLLPAFTKQTGVEVRVVAVGTGQALKIGEVATAMWSSCTTSRQSLLLSSE